PPGDTGGAPPRRPTPRGHPRNRDPPHPFPAAPRSTRRPARAGRTRMRPGGWPRDHAAHRHLQRHGRVPRRHPRPGLETILEGIGAEPLGGVSRPLDLLALQEVRSHATTSEYVVGLLNARYGDGVYARGSLDGRTTGAGTQGLVYNTLTVELLGEAAVGTASASGQPRQALRYHLRPVGTDGGAD